jgi:hypothetical protein
MATVETGLNIPDPEELAKEDVTLEPKGLKFYFEDKCHIKRMVVCTVSNARNGKQNQRIGGRSQTDLRFRSTYGWCEQSHSFR